MHQKMCHQRNYESKYIIIIVIRIHEKMINNYRMIFIKKKLTFVNSNIFNRKRCVGQCFAKGQKYPGFQRSQMNLICASGSKSLFKFCNVGLLGDLGLRFAYSTTSRRNILIIHNKLPINNGIKLTLTYKISRKQ